MKVSEIMRTVLVTATMDHTIEHARKIMKMKHIRHLLVVDGSKLVGIVTDRDVRSHVSPRVGTPIESTSDKATLESKLHQVMTRDLITVSPDTPVSEAARLILEHKIGCLPVIDRNGFTIGIITDADLLRYLAKEAQAEENK